MPKTPPIKKNKSMSENWYEIIDGLCNRFMGLSPFEVMNTDIHDVYQLYVDVIIHNQKENENPTSDNRMWVTSKNASWH